jgi:hypothetical protein
MLLSRIFQPAEFATHRAQASGIQRGLQRFARNDRKELLSKQAPILSELVLFELNYVHSTKIQVKRVLMGVSPDKKSILCYIQVGFSSINSRHHING